MSVHDFCAVNGYLDACERAGGVMFVHDTITAGEIGRSASTDSRDGVSDRWQYQSLVDAIMAWVRLRTDLAAVEPTGWVRHQPSNRRRQYNADGTCEREWVAP